MVDSILMQTAYVHSFGTPTEKSVIGLVVLAVVWAGMAAWSKVRKTKTERESGLTQEPIENVDMNKDDDAGSLH